MRFLVRLNVWRAVLNERFCVLLAAENREGMNISCLNENVYLDQIYK